MLKGVVARRYAAAIYDLAVEQGTLDRWLADVRVLSEYLGNRRLAFILSEPNIAFERKEQIIRDLLGAKVQPEALNVALLLAERGLVDAAPRISQEFELRYNDYKNQVVATVTTARPLDDETRTHLTSDLATITGKRILLEEQVDPTILGGAIARVGDTLIDGSVRRRLALLRQQMVRGGGWFGGPADGLDGRGEPPAGDGGGLGGAATTPFVVTPPAASNGASGDAAGGNGSTPAGGPSSATEMAPRSGQSAHLGPPRQPGSTDRRPNTKTTNTNNTNSGGSKRNKRRR